MDREQIVWNTKSNEPEQILSDISIIKDSKIVCGCNGFYYLSAPNAISFYNFDTNVSNLVIDVTSNINDIAFCSDVNILAIACSNKTTIIWDIVKQSKKVLKGHLRKVTSVAIGGEYHQWIATGSSDHTICIWNINS